ncbi:hypothetical protein DSL72_002518 [Monilinia vaccinii-corymbosi]|uniref:RanBD1 domain-containing protein n=1 Tax=Monilinia vaccinii-corymbosi TaxID=61207 RepID=A0A8A3PCW3_9HELO|nr:hypothetical protein DSL72_002518 [Monilinia vaccinii-corymbosi]
MDSPTRANAAQMAARTIKAKPKGRLNSQKSGFAPVPSNNNAAAAPAGGSGGGLFGGGISAPTSFDFAAPSGISATPTFSPSFGSTPNPFAQSAAAIDEDPRADTTGEEAARRGKGFRAAGENEGALFAAHSPYHHNQLSNPFGSSFNTQPQSLFGAANAAQSTGGGLQFGSSMSQNQAGNPSFDFNFSSTSQVMNNNSNSPFAFGSSSQAPPANNSAQPFTFGGTNSGQENSLFGTNPSSHTQNSLTFENQKASNFNFESSSVLDNSNFYSPTTFSTNQFDNPTFEEQHFYPNENTETMFGSYKVPDAGQAPAQPQTPQNQNPMNWRYYGGHMTRPNGSIFRDLSLSAARTNMDNVQDNSSTTFGQNNTNNFFGAQDSSLGGSFGGSFGTQANTSFTALNSTNIGASNPQSIFGSTSAATSAPSSAITPSFPANTSASGTSNLFGNAASSFPTASAPSTTNIFGNVNSSFPPAAASTTPLFGAIKPADSTMSASSTPLFGAVKPADSTMSASSTPLFGAVKPADSNASASSTPLFGAVKPADSNASASSTPLFGAVKSADSNASASSTPLFGAVKPADSNTSTSSTPLFGAAKTADSTTSSSGTPSIFAQSSAAASGSPFSFGKPAQSTPDLFNSNNQNNGQSRNLFGSKSAGEPKDKQTLDLFNANKPVGQQVSKSNATENATEKTPAKTPAKTPSALFETFGKANPSRQPFSSPSIDQAGSSFKIRGNAEATGYNKAPPFKPLDAPAQTPSSNALVGLSSQSQDTQALNGSSSNGAGSDSLTLSAQSSGPVTRVIVPGQSSNIEFQISEPTAAEMDANVPQGIDPKRKIEFYALFRITSVHRAMAAYFHHLPPGADPSKGLAWMEAKKKAIFAEYKIDYISNKRGRAEAQLEDDETQENTSPQKRIRPDKASSNRVQSPEKRPRPINESQSQLHGSSALKAPRPQSHRSSSPGKSSSTPGKSSSTPAKLSSTPAKSSSTPAKSSSTPVKSSSTPVKSSSTPVKSSSTPVKSSSRSAAPEPTSIKKRKSDAQMEPGDEEDRRNKKKKPEQSGRDEEAVSSGGRKRKPDVYLTQDDPEGIEDAKSGIKRSVNASSSSTSNMFKNILDSPDKSSTSATPERKTRALPGAPKETSSVPAEASSSNPFGTLPGASPIKSNTSATSTTPRKPPVFKFPPTSTTPTTSPAKPPTFTGTSTGGIKPPTFSGAPTDGIKPPTFTDAPTGGIKPPTFAGAPTDGIKPPTFTGAPTGGIKPPTFAGAPTDGIKPPTFTGAPTGGIKPPTFAGAPTGGIKPPAFGSGPANFMAQFGKQAAESAEDNEKKLMQKAKDEDFDSEDDDEAEWEANYKKKRAAELKELAELAKGKAPAFLVKPTESKGTEKPAATNIFAQVAATASTPLFGQAKSATGAAESIFSSANVSKTSTPNSFSGTGSILDGAASASGKTPSFAGNPFAHLSDADSNNQNDGDDESSDGGSDGEGEKKDPSYKQNTGNGKSSTPVDEVSSSVASKKAVTEPPKLNLFGSTASSGATTPTPSNGGSLLSRMSRDPVTEEKEDSTSKSTPNIFGSSLSATSGSSADKTWKPDSPIKFGNAAPSAATFSITGSSPIKPATNSFGGLFGNSGTSTPAPSSGPTATTGFQFGGPASATSSLFPSMAASANTSRATSPGATTDGATDADDNDTEKVDEQVNLLESNPGEEDEDVVYSVRARALKFCPNEEGEKKASPWDTKGVGPLKVLRHKVTKATRIVLRSDPSGSIILNKSLLSQVKYEASGKTIKLMTLGDDGKGLQTWVLNVKEIGLAEELAKCLEDNKVNNK